MELTRFLISMSTRKVVSPKCFFSRSSIVRKEDRIKDSMKRASEWRKRAESVGMQSILDEDLSRRQKMTTYGRQLDSRFNRAIREELTSSAFSEKIQSLNFTEIRLSPCFNKLEILWQGSAKKYSDNETQRELVEAIPRLRSLLFRHRLVQRIPELIFVKDLRPAFASQVDNLLDKVINKEEVEETEEEKEENLRSLYPYHDQLRIEQERKQKKWTDRQRTDSEDTDPEAYEPPGTDFYNSAAGLEYDVLLAKVLRTIQKSTRKRGGAMSSVDGEDNDGGVSAQHATQRAAKAREEAKREFRAIRDRRRRERKSYRNVWDEEEEWT